MSELETRLTCEPADDALAPLISWAFGDDMLSSLERLKRAIPDYWMLRVVHVAQALLTRGYAPLDAEVDLEVEDDLLPENTRTYPLRVRAGIAELGSIGAPQCARISVAALAALYTGFVGPDELVFNGQLAADAASLRSLGALFAGPAPACPDYF